MFMNKKKEKIFNFGELGKWSLSTIKAQRVSHVLSYYYPEHISNYIKKRESNFKKSLKCSKIKNGTDLYRVWEKIEDYKNFEKDVKKFERVWIRNALWDRLPFI